MITHQPLQPVEVERGVVFGSAPVGHGGSRPGLTDQIWACRCSPKNANTRAQASSVASSS